MSPFDCFLILKWEGWNWWSLRSLQAPKLMVSWRTPSEPILATGVPALSIAQLASFIQCFLAGMCFYSRHPEPILKIRILGRLKYFNHLQIHDIKVTTFPSSTIFALLSKKERKKRGTESIWHDLLWIKAHLLIISNFIVFWNIYRSLFQYSLHCVSNYWSGPSMPT